MSVGAHLDNILILLFTGHYDGFERYHLDDGTSFYADTPKRTRTDMDSTGDSNGVAVTAREIDH